MATKTSILGLTKPATSDKYNVADFNTNFDIIDTILSKLYPVGTIYMTTNSANPSTYFGFGTWVAWGSGQVPVGVDSTNTNFNTVEKTGGEQTHQLTQNELPKVSGTLIGVATYASSCSGVFTSSRENYNGVGGGSNNWTSYFLNFGNNQAHNNLQPYITCYMWKRTA